MRKKRNYKNSAIALLLVFVAALTFVLPANGQGILSPRYLRQDGATDQQRLCWTTANGYWAPCSDSGSGVTTLNTLTGATQTFADVDDTNVTIAIASTGTTHTWTLGWSGVLGLSRGGAGADLSATGGANQFVKQSSAGAVLTVGTIGDADVPNTITIDLSATATALAANPTDCSAGQYATTIATNGNLTCAQIAWSEIGSTTDVVTTTVLDDGADTPGSGEYVRVDTVDQVGFEYRTVAEVLSDIGAAASAHTHGASTIDEDAIGTSELDDDANTPAAASFVVVETGAASFDYLAANAGTDITDDLEEETHASEHTTGGADIITVDGVDAGAGTTRTDENKIQIASHNTDCTSLTDGTARELCYEEDSDAVYVCEPTAGGCDTAAEWRQVGSGGATVTTSTFANIPTCAIAGDQWYQDADEGPLSAVCDGSTWIYSGWGLHNITLPPTTGWSTDFAGGTTATTTGGFIKLTRAASSGTDIEIYRRNVPSDPTVTPYFVELCVTHPIGVHISGTALFDDTGSNDGTIATYNTTGGANSLFVAKYDLPTAGLLASITTATAIQPAVSCWGLEEDATDRKIYIGNSPADLVLHHSEGRTVTYTATDVGVVSYTGDAAYIQQMNLIHYRVR